MTRQISHKIETYQMERLVEDGMVTHHAISILSKSERRREDEGKGTTKTPQLNTGESTTSHDHQVI